MNPDVLSILGPAQAKRKKSETPDIELPGCQAKLESLAQLLSLKDDLDAKKKEIEADLFGPVEAARVQLSRDQRHLFGAVRVNHLLTYITQNYYKDLPAEAVPAVRSQFGPLYDELFAPEVTVEVDAAKLTPALAAQLKALGCTVKQKVKPTVKFHELRTMDSIIETKASALQLVPKHYFTRGKAS